jgi:hypothetical protein
LRSTETGRSTCAPGFCAAQDRRDSHDPGTFLKF